MGLPDHRSKDFKCSNCGNVIKLTADIVEMRKNHKKYWNDFLKTTIFSGDVEIIKCSKCDEAIK